MSKINDFQLSLSVFSDDTFPRYNYTKDRVKTLLTRFKRLRFKTKALPSDNEISIMELNCSKSRSTINNWIKNDENTDLTQESAMSNPTPVIFISDYTMDFPENCIYGVMIETGLNIKADSKKGNVICSSIKGLKENVDRLLERYALSFLKDLSENALHRIQATPDFKENGVEAIKCLLSDVMAVYNRSCAPRQEWPGVENKETPVLDKTWPDELFECDASIKGFGYQHDSLQIVVDRQYDETIFEAISNYLNIRNITKYHINWGPWTETPLCDIKVGNELVVAERRGTLGGFALKDDHLYALTSRHLLDNAEDHNTGLSSQGNGTSVNEQYVYINNTQSNTNILFAIAEPGYTIGELDIAAVKIVQPENIADRRLRDSRGRHRNNMIFNFQNKPEQEIKKLLQSERVHAWTKERLPRLGKISIPIYFVRGMQFKYLVIENEYSDAEEQHAGAAEYGDIPNPNAFGMPGDSGAIICSDDVRSQGVHAYSMFIGKLQNNDKTMYLSLRLQDGLYQLSNNQEQQTRSRYQLC
ncbi:uncharacterized protein LOC127833936 isoform X1 [Dreissena polymorpha]|uniref:Uncharacterized protein n=2 Tax=Dreissena polymorpha TaxID=45954 RepID=A0A9D4G0L8_DREPO|nr:uncharacterized protein LOC127833936 isoform X1 [Dreissena polymorpha]KAH3806400.1 hypothetical protein DPMN_134721 [Dreissena polymorpha]